MYKDLKDVKDLCGQKPCLWELLGGIDQKTLIALRTDLQILTLETPFEDNDIDPQIKNTYSV